MHLAGQGFIKLDKKANTKISLTVKGQKTISKFENYFIKAKKRTNIQLMGKSFNLKLNEYREIFPAGKIPSGKPARVRMYVNEYRDKEYMYMKTSQYFIAKEGKNKVKSSDLADYCDMIRDGVQTEEDHFKEKVV